MLQLTFRGGMKIHQEIDISQTRPMYMLETEVSNTKRRVVRDGYSLFYYFIINLFAFLIFFIYLCYKLLNNGKENSSRRRT
jgi:hypothetical protein